MDDQQQRLIQWAVSNADKLGLQVTRYNWPEQLGVNLTDCSVSLKRGSLTHIGRGSDEDEKVALVRAIHEALDRHVMVLSGAPSSNGSAVHFTATQAVESAHIELLERDLFFCHILTQTRFLLPHPDTLASPLESQLQAAVTRSGASIDVLEMRSHGRMRFFVCIGSGLNRTSGRRFGLTIGMGADRDPNRARSKAVRECARHLSVWLATDTGKSMDISTFNALSESTPGDHSSLAADLDYARNFIGRFFPVDQHPGPSAQELDIEKLENFDFRRFPLCKQFEDCQSWGAIVEPTPFYNLEIQLPFFGKPHPVCINLKRISDFAGKSLTWDQVCKLPHPMG